MRGRVIKRLAGCGFAIYEAGESGAKHYENGVDPEEPNEECAHYRNDHIWQKSVYLFFPHGEYWCRNECHYSWTETEEDTLDIDVLPEGAEDGGQNENENNGHKDVAKDGDGTPPPFAETESRHCSDIDGEDARHCLTDGDAVEKLFIGNPSMLFDKLTLHERNHGVTTADSEGAYLEEAPEDVGVSRHWSVFSVSRV